MAAKEMFPLLVTKVKVVVRCSSNLDRVESLLHFQFIQQKVHSFYIIASLFNFRELSFDILLLTLYHCRVFFYVKKLL